MNKPAGAGFPRHSSLFAAIAWRALGTMFRLRVRGASLQSVLEKMPPAGAPASPHLVDYLVRYTEFLRRLLGINYLERCLVIFYFLRLWGIGVEFHLGVRYLKDRLKWHAWLTQKGNLVFERPFSGPAFTELLVWPKEEAPA